jgi:uncharacterized membrane protein YqiK
MESHILYWVIGGAGGFALAVFETLLIRSLFRVPPPHKLLVVSGRQYRQGGKTRGFAVYGRPRAVIPVVERSDELDTTCVPCTVAVRNAYLKGGVRIHVQWLALVAISRDPALTSEAVERFLGRPLSEVGQVATETFEGVARGLLATADLQDVEDPGFAVRLAAEAEPSLQKMGLAIFFVTLERCGTEV